ncbi:uncharacterized protein LOC112042622 [Lingula anatina]|uniref:Uncharacterized protein LOC112042622 n=1 Tax=Lingula anatina TaxID=7574 RepID=A0A2R2MT59_LINAN|nr:uncharacterized protein LOC112042622 [Lingula anatina]|eukprot:XP_023933212.1 uncharacterized protein LOC112042622 [Lingula anatina]
MPKGPSYDNYWMTIYTNITDSDGSTTTYKVGRIQVNPMSTTEVESLVSNLTASGSTNMIAQIAANGNLEDTTQTIQSLASVLNTLGSSEGFNSGFGPSEATSTQNTSSAEKEALREEVALIRTQMIDAVSDSAPTTPRQVQLLASCLTEVLQQPSEIKRGSQSKVTAIVSGFIDVLQAQAADQSKEETVELATTILSSVGATIALVPVPFSFYFYLYFIQSQAAFSSLHYTQMYKYYNSMSINSVPLQNTLPSLYSLLAVNYYT